ncbi:universal stress protein [Actinoplanes sp. KI2]|uniref:universal stress protein n=1 Tax=Actinoplanes sp. KI2 TaxID=2983315 RepID=UPI0021D5A502|nr:universal stress protein [Actinoplanes sp. KI2]MCU7731132.1 universal stress protein [Actinoplanes sp. KI2]
MAILVGTDGTDCSLAAVEWAAIEAQRRNTPLRIVHAFDWDWHESRFAIGTEYIDVGRRLAEALLVEAADRARECAPAIDIATYAIAGHAAPSLLGEAHGMELLVVGSRGRGGFAGLLLGSVSQRVATHAPCPVAVIRGHDVPGGPIVAGIDDSAAAEQVLAAAFDEAAVQGCGLIVLRSLAPAFPPWLADVRRADLLSPADREAELRRIEEQLAPWRDKYPGVLGETVLTHDAAASALVLGSRESRLVVVGSRGHGSVAGSLLGAVGLQLLHHAASPVLIVREPTPGSTRRPT